jgi:hypothetical protein
MLRRAALYRIEQACVAACVLAACLLACSPCCAGHRRGERTLTPTPDVDNDARQHGSHAWHSEALSQRASGGRAVIREPSAGNHEC